MILSRLSVIAAALGLVFSTGIAADSPLSGFDVGQAASMSLWQLAAAGTLLAVVWPLLPSRRKSDSATRDGELKALLTLMVAVTERQDYSLRAPMPRDAALAQLAQALNNMLGQVELRDTMLQKQVLQRASELEKLTSEFRHSAYHDALTGLPNHALLSEYFSIAVERASREDSSFCLLMMDLDNFKVINDTLGHDFGDELLVQVARRLEGAVRRDDTVFRPGGDEFVILASGVSNEADVEAIARHLLDSLKRDLLIKDERIKATISIGGAMFSPQAMDLVSLKRNADLAMYRAKENGKARFQMYQANMEALAAQRMMVQNDLRSAIKRGELLPYFQPKVDASCNRIVGCEVLVRWRHPKHGFLSPAQFIPFAEENGLVRILDYHILEQACRSARHWRDEHGYRIPVAVNLSGIHFRDEEIVEVVARSLESQSLSPDLLEIELTEAVFIGDPKVALNTLNQLKALGVRISLDDFGIGYSSLHYLRTLPVDVVKLDKSFIQNLAVSPQERQLTKGIISLASELGFEVVAEGVETKAQLQQLLQLNCRFMQGYYFCRPGSEPEFLDWIARQHQQEGYSVQ